MAANGNGNGANPTSLFGKQLRKERLSRGWSLDELARRTGTAAGHWSRVENGKRPPTEFLAKKLDEVFERKDRYYIELYDEMRTWMPPGFRDWPEIENTVTRMNVWSPNVIDGLIQTEAYARALLETSGATEDIIAVRLANRMKRQRAFFAREVRARFIVDHAALYRLTGSPETMADQMHHLTEIAARPGITLQVLPAVAHPATQSSFIVTDNAGYAEHVLGGFVYVDEPAVAALENLFDVLRAECYRASESLLIIRKAEATWTFESRATAGPTAGSA